MLERSDNRYVPTAVAVRMFFIFAFAYVLSYGLRSINAVIAPSLRVDLSLTSSELGLLASAYFFSFAVMQLPVGALLDRFGPRRVEALLMLFAAAGAFLFAQAQSFVVLWLARALIGVGVSACLMASIQAYTLYFRPHMQASMSSWMLMAGSLGALSVTTPVNTLLPVIGWRGVFVGIGLLCIVASMALWFGMPRLFNASPTMSWRELINGYKQVFRHSHFWTVVPISIFQQGGFLAFHGLWLGPWLMTVHDMSANQAAHAMFIFSAVLMAAYFLLGLLTRKLAMRGVNEDWIMAVGIGAALLLVSIQVLTRGALGLPGWLVYAATSSAVIIAYTSANRPFPKELAGRSSTALNLLIFVGAFCLQWGLGVGIDYFKHAGLPEWQAMQYVMRCLVAAQALSWLWFVLRFRRGFLNPEPLHTKS